MPNNPWTGPMPFQPASAYNTPNGGGLPSTYYNSAAGFSAPGSLPWSAVPQAANPMAGNQQRIANEIGQSRPNINYGMGANGQVTGTHIGSGAQAAMPQAPGQAPMPGQGSPSGGGMSNLANIPPMYLPTRQSQNMLMAKAAQQASPGSAINQLVGNTGVQSSSGTVLSQLGKPMIDSYREGALGAANLGIDDQLLRDQHLLRGILGHGQADIGALRAMGNRERIGIDGQNQITNSMVNLLRSLGGMFNTNNLLGSAGDIGGLF